MPRPTEAWPLVKRLVPRTVGEFVSDACPHLAASIAFRVLFALFPLAIVVTAVFGLTSAAVGFRPDVIDAIVDQVPLTDDGRRRLRGLLEETGGIEAVGIVGLAGLIWAASGMMSAVRTALNLAWDVEDGRPWLIGKAWDVLFVFAMAPLVVMSVALGLTVRLGQGLMERVGLAGGVSEALIGSAAPFVLSLAVVIAAYRFAPATSPRVVDLIAPSVLVAAAFTLAQALFALYLESFGRYNAIYGSFGVVVAVMLFVYLASLVFLLGAELAAETPRVRDELRRGQGVYEAGPPLAVRAREALKGLVVRSHD